MNANVTKMQIFHNIPLDLIITLTYVFMDNFCPYLFSFWRLAFVLIYLAFGG